MYFESGGKTSEVDGRKTVGLEKAEKDPPIVKKHKKYKRGKFCNHTIYCSS